MSKAKIIADSISEQGVRITTLELSMPRYILSQFNTHRMFSRSAQSSRAVPVQKMIDAAEKNAPPHFMKNEKGMQSSEEFKDWERDYAVKYWNEAKHLAIMQAKQMMDLGVHKQFVNRLIEPFSTVKVVVTATEFDNFFKLRLHHAAQPEMKTLAQAMRDAMDGSRPDILSANEWHLPYISDSEQGSHAQLALISAARCARVSYLNHDNSNPDFKSDFELANRLLVDGHLSPFEHQAKPMQHPNNMWHGSLLSEDGTTHTDKKGNVHSGNFRGWIQHRQLIGDQNNG